MVISGTGYFGINVQNWANGEFIAMGSISESNYGGSWVSIKAYPHDGPMG